VRAILDLVGGMLKPRKKNQTPQFEAFRGIKLLYYAMGSKCTKPEGNNEINYTY